MLWLAQADPQDISAPLPPLLSAQYGQAHKYQECVDAGREELKLNVRPAETLNNMSSCLAGLGKLDEGIAAAREALRIKPGFLPASVNLGGMLMTMSEQAFRANQFQECIDAARQVRELEPDNAEAYINLGACSAHLGKWDEGIRNTREALRLKPDFPVARQNLAWMLQEKAKTAARTR